MRIFQCSLAPQSGIGRVIVAVLVAVFATMALLAWAPANAYICDRSQRERPPCQIGSGDS